MIINSPGPLTWPTQRNKFLPKKFLILTSKKGNITHLKELVFYQEEKFFALNRKNNQFSKRKNFLCLSEKKQFSKQKNILIITSFPNKKFVMLVWKTNVLYLHKKNKALHVIRVLNMALLSFLLVKPNRDFNKLKVSTNSINQFSPRYSKCEKGLCLEFSWSICYCIWTEYEPEKLQIQALFTQCN